MDYKEKYEKALARAKAQSIDGYLDAVAVSDIFPELTESEDEKIRNVLVDYFKRYKEQEKCGIKTFYGIPTDNIIAWLGKQGEQKSFDYENTNIQQKDFAPKSAMEAIKEEKVDNANKIEPKDYSSIDPHFGKPIEQKPVIKMKTPEESLGIDSDTFNEIVDECIYGEQKPANKVEPKFKVGDTIKYFGERQELSEAEHTIKEIKNDMYVTTLGALIPLKYEHNYELVAHKPQRIVSAETKEAMYDKPAWSEEDECYMSECIGAIATKDGWSFEEKRKTKHWLKSLKDRVQPQSKQEWSEEDVRNIQDIDSVLFYDKNLSEDTCMRLRNWLESIRPQSQWKPSDEQIEALESATENCASSEYQDCLRELIGQLKKLREE